MALLSKPLAIMCCPHFINNTQLITAVSSIFLLAGLTIITTAQRHVINEQTQTIFNNERKQANQLHWPPQDI